MDKSDWQRCRDPREMLQFLEGQLSERKLWLFACACCRYSTRLLPGDAYHRTVDIGERFADQLASSITRQMVCRVVARWQEQVQDQDVTAAAYLSDCLDVLERMRWRPFQVAWLFCDLSAVPSLFSWTASPSDERQPLRERLRTGEQQYRQFQCQVLRDLRGDPFAPAEVDPAWLEWHNGTVVRLAQAIYETRAFDRMGILGDALEDAGCTEAALLDHCRTGKEHTRGCHVLDALLGKQGLLGAAG